MAETLEKKVLSPAAAVVRNPLSVIAMFVLLVEAIATITLINVSGEHNIAPPLVWFVVLFPALVTLLFFGTLWWGHQRLYSPMEYRSDESFLIAMENRVEAKVDKVKQETKSDIDEVATQVKILRLLVTTQFDKFEVSHLRKFANDDAKLEVDPSSEQTRTIFRLEVKHLLGQDLIEPVTSLEDTAALFTPGSIHRLFDLSIPSLPL